MGAGIASSTDAFTVTGVTISETTGTAMSMFGGYNYSIGSNFVVGAEVFAILGGATANSFPLPGATHSNVFAGRLRAGYATGDALLFAGIGYATAQMNFAGLPPGFLNDSTGTQGFLGVDYAINEQVFARLEYQSIALDVSDLIFGPTAESTLNSISVGLGLRF